MADQRHRHGVFSGTQLLTTAPAEAAAFYRALLGWTTEVGELEGVEHHRMFNHGEAVASILGVPAEEGVDGTAHWHPQLAVDDVDSLVRLAEELGGRVVVPPGDIPELGRLAVIQDPGGAVLTLVGAAAPDAVPDAVDVDGD